MDSPTNRTQDTFRYDAETIAALADQFTIEPVAPPAIRERIDEGEVLVTMDIPGHLDRSIASDADTSIVLYRLIQLFGTPNVPGLEAGGDQPDRRKTTWHYLFETRYSPEDDGPDEEYLLSVYDYQTDFSVGLSEWHRPESEPGRPALEPSAERLPSETVPDDEFLVATVQLILATVEHAVDATYKNLYV